MITKQTPINVTVDMLLDFLTTLQTKMQYCSLYSRYYVLSEDDKKLYFCMSYMDNGLDYCLLGLFFKLNLINQPNQDVSDYVAQYLNLPEPLIYECFYCYSPLDNRDFPYHVNRTLSILNKYKLTGDI